MRCKHYSDPFDGWQTLGIILPAPSNSTMALYQSSYENCRTEWCIRSESDSFFTYSNGTAFLSHFERDTLYVPGLEELVAAASPELLSICGAEVQCIIDGTSGTMIDAHTHLTSLDLTRAPTDLPIPTPAKAPTNNKYRGSDKKPH